ncbi:CAR1 transcription factor [Calliphora vicina]|uniref:CAR1 transcription factor n=1 Tax=Calliphora vicina TaxID=7373 RepID=UPI00325BF758
MSERVQQTIRSTYTSSGGFLLLLLLFQTVQPLFSLHNAQHYNKRLPQVGGSENLPADKRTLTSRSGIGGSAGQPEEIFSASDQLESNYDEYPMVVPKRAALLLDRLMVALHHALEKEHSGSARLSEFYNNKNNNNNNNNKNIPTGVNERNKGNDKDDSMQDNKDSPYLAMYSDDDPTVMMDYDFKDLNSINRATGETLMAQSFQRRANVGLDLGGDMGVEGVSSLLDASSSSALSRGLLNGYNGGDISVGGVGGVVGVGGGRTATSYWRCYFNAVSCF